MIATIDSVTLESAARTLITWLGHAVVYGTLLALMTAVVLRLFARRLGHAIHVALWLIVLARFVLPVAPASPVSLATLTTSLVAPLHNDTPAVKDASALTGPISVFFVGDKPAPRTAAAASPAAPWRTIVAGGYLAIVTIIAVARIVSFRRFVARCRRLPRVDDATLALVAEACHRLRARRIPDVRLSEHAPAPFVLGTLSPMLILSRRHLVRPDETEAVILHEIAHLRRGDLLVRYVQWIAGTLLFFWPVVAWVNRRIDLAREQACDEWALRHGRLSAGEYARCILRALHPARPGAWLYRPAAMAANLSTIERRIDMILNTNGAPRSRRALRWPVVALLAAWAAFALSGAATAQDGDTPPSTGGKVVRVNTQTADADGTVETEVVSDDGKTFNIRLDGADGAQQFVIELVGEAVQMHGPGQRVMIRGNGVPGALHEGIFVPAPENALADFAEDYPAADVDGDGAVTHDERGAYMTALAMSAPDVVLTQYPFLDENENGLLEAEEAAHMFGGVGMFIVHMKADVEADAGVATDAQVQVELDLHECDAAVVETQDGVAMQRIRLNPPDGQEPPDVLTEILPPTEWLLQNVTADLTVDTVAAYLEVVQAERAEMHEIHSGAWVPEAGSHHFFSPNNGQVRVELRPNEPADAE